jgi:YegS/Rv2252/BmrU family lipid kinase
VTSVGVIAHPGKTLGDGLGALRASLAGQGIHDPLWREAPTGESVPELVTELVDAGVDLLFVWGGDGTVQQCINAVGTAPVALAIMPAGTANLLAGNLGIPPDLEAAVDIGLSGRRRKLDLGAVNGERFSVMAGIGFDALMIRDADAGLKDRLGRLAYVATGIGGVTRAAVRARVAIDGTTWFDGPSTCVLVGNMGDLFGGLSVFPNAEPDDGLLNVGIITADSVMDWARTLGATVLGDAGSSPFVETTIAAGIDVNLDEALPYELDGEARPETKHLEFHVEPAAVTVCTPDGEEKR